MNELKLGYALLGATVMIVMIIVMVVYNGAASLLSAKDSYLNILGGVLLVVILVSVYLISIFLIKWFNKIKKTKE